MSKVSKLVMMAAAFGMGMSYRNSRPDPPQTEFPRDDAAHLLAAKQRRRKRALRKAEMEQRSKLGRR